MKKTPKHIVPQLFLLSIIIIICQSTAFAAASRDVSFRRTVEAFVEVPCLTSDELAYGKQVLRGLDYNSKRAVRQLSLLPGTDFESSKKAWGLLLSLHLSYEQLLIFEDWADLEGATMEQALQLLPKIKTMRYEAGKSFRAYIKLPNIRPSFALRVIPILTTLDDAKNKAAEGLFSIEDMEAKGALDHLLTIGRFNDKQAWACAAFAGVKRMNRETMVDAMPLIRQLRRDDAWNARTLFKQEDMTRIGAWEWLVSYFATPPPVQEVQYLRLTREKRKTLLNAFYDAGEELVWKINNLHAVTDEYGREISRVGLAQMSSRAINARFQKLSRKTRYVYSKRFTSAYKAGQRRTLVSVLRQATSADRKQVSRDLTSANIYALLAQGSELYDSSFRDILTPILKGRIRKSHNGNLLLFLKDIDPDNLLVANFIVSLAQKGKLTTFFPTDSVEQERILELVAMSAFKDEDTIMLFSATLKHLLTVLEPGARKFFIERMTQEAASGNCIFTRLITVILQYYLEEYPQLLGPQARLLITRAVIHHGSVDLSRFLVTPFPEWKADGRLGSISIFHPDDDGRQSFLSNGRSLINNGYRITASDQYTPLQSVSSRKKSTALIRRAGKNPASSLAALFSAMRTTPFAVAFVKKMNGITIRHSVYVYSDEEDQQQVLQRFLQGGDEMLAQRGHSYWRSEQITDPVRMLREKRLISDRDLTAKQRFLSLGSCGGVKAYTRLTKLFLGHVDILATIGTGIAIINDPYNRHFFEIIAKNPSTITWKEMADKSSFIFAGGRGRDYLQPGSLTAILHKILAEERKNSRKRSADSCR